MSDFGMTIISFVKLTLFIKTLIEISSNDRLLISKYCFAIPELKRTPEPPAATIPK